MFFTLLSTEQTADKPLTPDEHDLIAGLYDAYAPRVRFLAAQILKNDMDADDALVEVFIRVMRYKEKFVGIDEKQICRLIVLFTRSTCIDLYRRRERYQSVHVAMTAEDEDGELYDLEFSDGFDILEDMVARETAEHLKEALASLSSPAKEIILMKYYGGMKNREIADFFGMKLPTVAVMIHRAMLKMRKQLEGYMNETSQET